MILAQLSSDVTRALRGFRRRPGFAAIAVLTLALGIGANATMFGVVDRLLLRAPAHITEPDRVVRFYTSGRSMFSPEPVTTPFSDYQSYLTLRERAGCCTAVAGHLTRDVTLGRGSDAQLVTATLATANFFPLLGVRPALGRFYSEQEDREGATPVVVLGHDIWRSRFGGRADIVGRDVLVQGKNHTVVGVAPRGFTGVALGRTDLWLPLNVAGADVFGNLPGLQWQNLGGSWMGFIGRLKPEITAPAASAEATRLLSGLRNENPNAKSDVRISAGSIVPGRGPEPSAESRIAVWLAAMAVVVLLVACANVANLLLARAVERRREIAVQLAMGAGRARLIAQLLTEGVVLAMTGGMAALLIAWWGAGSLRSVLLPRVVWDSAPVDLRVFSATAVVALGTAVITGLVPALQASRTDVASALKLGQRSGGSTSDTATRSALLIAQSALSVVLLVGAGLFVRSLRNLENADLGLDARRVLAVSVDLPAAAYPRERVAAFFDQAADAVRAMPGVARVSVTAAHPFGNAYGGGLQLAGRDSLPTLPGGGPYEYDVSPGYFATLGTPLRRGRDFTDDDRTGAPLVIIVNETLARTYWRGADPIGQCVRVSGRGDACAQVVGVIADSHRSRVRESASLVYYMPLAQSLESYTGATRTLLVRSANDQNARALAPSVQRTVQALAPDLPFVKVVSLDSFLASEMQPVRLGATLFSVFGILAVLVAAVGLYGVVSFGVAQRTREFGVRLALGADSSDIIFLVLRQGVRHAVVGIALGLAVTLLGGSRLVPLLYNTSPRDGTIMTSVALVLLTVAVIACAAPAWRATRVQPAIALRSE